MPSDSTWSPPASSERRLSNSSDGSGSGSGYSKATSDSADFLATRPHTASVLPGKPAANPLQFVKVGPADLGTKAREQLRRAELAKKTEPARIERQEDWQSNLDNWKSSRRKRVEHIIERCVEVRRFENEIQPRGKSKTFNEMLEERAGRRRRNPLALYTEDDGHDLSDLGIGTSSTKSSLSEDCDTHSLASDGMDLDKNHSDVETISNCDNNRKLGSSANEYDTCTTMTISSPEPEEYTYEGAIEGYKSRIISQTNSNIVKTVVNNNVKENTPEKTNGDINRIRTSVSNKIEEKVSSFQHERANDLKNNNQKKDLPKVDIHKRREQFEREHSQELQLSKPKVPEIANKKSIKERLSCLEKFNEDIQLQKSTNDLAKLPGEVKPLKDRLNSLEKVKSANAETEKNKRLSNGDLSNSKSLRERLTSLKSQKSEEEVKVTKTEVKEVSMSIKERLSCLDAAKNKEIPKIAIEAEIISDDKIPEQTEHSELKDKLSNSSLKLNLAGIENQMQSFCRSLDSLDINDQSSPNSFDRVQSLEDFDCAEMQNNTVPSDIETEDSGIHTARDSCAPADDIADLTQVASPIGEPMAEVSEYESSNEYNDTIMTLEPAKTEKPIGMDSEPYQMNDEVQGNEEEDSDSGSNYLQAVSQPEESSATEITEIQIDKEDEDTLKSLDNQDSSVSLNEPASTASEGDTVVFQGKMTIHVNLNDIRSSSGAGYCNTNNVANESTNNKGMVIDALELAFQELDSEESVDVAMDDTISNTTTASDAKITDNVDDLLNFDVNKKVSVTPLYENIDIFNQNLVESSDFPLDLPTNALEPPKEKPPPPPTEDGPDELLGNGNFKHTSSARRIKKEIRNKRTSFLGIEGQDDSYLDVDLKLSPRPDITSFLQEETKIEKLLYKKTLSHDNAKLRDSRDSGVDVDRGSETWYRGHSSPDTSSPHSRQNSEPYQMTVTSDEEEATKSAEQAFSKNLTTKLSGLTENGETQDNKIDHLDKKIQQQQEVLRFERELLQLEQEELRRQRENLLRDQNRIIQKSVQDISSAVTADKNVVHRVKGKNQNYRHSMPNLLLAEQPPLVIERTIMEENIKRKPFVSEEHIQSHFGVEESRKILFDDRRPAAGVMRPPQPVLPPKPRSRDSIEREITMRSSRVPSAVECVQVPVQRGPRAPDRHTHGRNYHPMSRHTLQVLSAAPTPKLISNSEWMQARPQPRQKQNNYNYNQHWLIQEAEQRRIQEQRAVQRVPNVRDGRDVTNLMGRDGRANGVRASHAPHITHYANSQVIPQGRSLELGERRPEHREDKMLSVSGRRKCSHCGDELGRGAAMIIESLSLCYHVWCFSCAACGAPLGDGRAGADVRVRGRSLHCHQCYSSDDGDKYSCV
nr:myosin-2 heavy chain isoform X2 [Danaus plexippus plexippus]